MNTKRIIKLPILLILLLLLFGNSSLGYSKGFIIKANTDSLNWYTMEQAQKLAKENNKKVFVFGQADWCHYCIKMEKEVFSKAETITLLNKYFYVVELTVDSDEELTFNGETYTMSHLSGMLGVDATPTLFFIDEHGEFIARQPGFMPAKVLNKILAFVGTNTYKEMSFTEYHGEKGRE